MEKLNLETYKDYANLRKAIGTIQKSGVNPHFKNTYVELNVAITVIDENIEAHNFVCFLQLPFVKDGENYLRTHLVHNNGDIIEGEIKLITTRQDPQMVGSSLTYMRRYSLITILGLKDKDDDGNKGSGKKTVLTDIQITKGLDDCKSSKELQTFWGELNADQKTKYEETKNKLKETLK